VTFIVNREVRWATIVKSKASQSVYKMYLLNVETGDLETYYGSETPPYAVLSHTWLGGEDEITFQDITDRETGRSNINKPHLEYKKGYFKVLQTCRQARKDGFKFVWIDTFCIDKSSSAELSEAINSMYRW